MTEGSSDMFWLDLRSQQAGSRCYRAGFEGSEHPIWVKYQSIVRVAIDENETRTQHSLLVGPALAGLYVTTIS